MIIPSRHAIILLAHGSRHPAPPQEIAALAADLQRAQPSTMVRYAFLDMLAPTLPEVVADAVGAGAKQVTVAPLFLNTGYHVTRDVPAMIAEARRRHPGVRFAIVRHIGAHPGYAALVHDLVLHPERHIADAG